MYLSTENCFKLDEIVKSFEVAYRSLVSKRIINSFKTEREFYVALDNIKIEASNLVNSGKLHSNYTRLKKNKKEVYTEINYSASCMLKKDYQKNDVIYVGELVDLTLFFFASHFNDLSANFENNEQFIYYSVKYQAIRNDLSHPASSKILMEDCKLILYFIRSLMEKIDTECYWYVSKDGISSKIESFLSKMEDFPISIHNIDEVDIQHKRLLFREEELLELKTFILGNGNLLYRKSSSVVVYGYGGVGKTALVIEFIHQLVKDIHDGKISSKIDYLLFFTSKEDRLEYSQTSGELYVNPLKKQIGSFNDFINALCKHLNISDSNDLSMIKDLNGVIIIDNIETLDQEKEKILNFIKYNCPRGMQFIVTSRNEERFCEDKLHIKEFNDVVKGISFIEEYIVENELDVDLSKINKTELVNGSKGNTLVLILSLLRLHDKVATIESIITELNSESQNVEIIADFMYKNTLDATIYNLELDGHKPIEVLRIISLYDEPIDLYSLSTLAGISINVTENVCNLLASKLVLSKIGELYSLNEFANKFVFIKFMPDPIEREHLLKSILLHKSKVKEDIEKLDRLKIESKLLRGIMEDWKPKNAIDQIAISRVFSLYEKAKRTLEGKDINEIHECMRETEETFQTYEVRTRHPYIRCQKARIYQLFLQANIDTDNSKKVINDNYEKMIYSVQFDYKYIKNTYSFASVLWIYGIFLNRTMNDQSSAIKYLEESKSIYETLNKYDGNYFKMMRELYSSYFKRYEQSSIKEYLYKAKDIYYWIEKNKGLSEFNVNNYLQYCRRELGLG